jgi:ribose 5-phosphate isomerase B
MRYDDEEIKALVRQVVIRTLGNQSRVNNAAANTAKRPILDADAVQALPVNTIHTISADTLVTPLARQVALERHIRLQVTTASGKPSATQTFTHLPAGNHRVVAIGADHGGYEMKEHLKKVLETAEVGYTVIDCGTHSTDSVDYPDFAYAVARLVADERAWRGIIIDGAGIGSCMAANKVPGVRAALCYDQATAVNSREHNNANVLTLGAGLIGKNLASQIVRTWLTTDFGGGRHARRVNKIDDIGRRFSK